MTNKWKPYVMPRVCSEKPKPGRPITRESVRTTAAANEIRPGVMHIILLVFFPIPFCFGSHFLWGWDEERLSCILSLWLSLAVVGRSVSWSGFVGSVQSVSFTQVPLGTACFLEAK